MSKGMFGNPPPIKSIFSSEAPNYKNKPASPASAPVEINNNSGSEAWLRERSKPYVPPARKPGRW